MRVFTPLPTRCALTAQYLHGIPRSMRCPKILPLVLCLAAASPVWADDPPAADAAKPEKPSAAALEEQTKRLKALGYKPEVQNGVTVFCRKETPLGTRFE